MLDTGDTRLLDASYDDSDDSLFDFDELEIVNGTNADFGEFPFIVRHLCRNFGKNQTLYLCRCRCD